MVYSCSLCEIDPLNHSLNKLKETDENIVFYSCASKAKMYYDCEGIIKHYDGVLSEIPNNKKWVWIFDSLDFNFSHFIQIDVGISLAKLISSKFSNNLLKIIIINPTIYVSLTYNIVMPFLSKSINDMIIFNENSNVSIDEILSNF